MEGSTGEGPTRTEHRATSTLVDKRSREKQEQRRGSRGGGEERPPEPRRNSEAEHCSPDSLSLLCGCCRPHAMSRLDLHSPSSMAAATPVAAAATGSINSPVQPSAAAEVDDDEQSFHSFASPATNRPAAETSSQPQSPSHLQQPHECETESTIVSLPMLSVSSPLAIREDDGARHITPRRRSSAAPHTPTRRLSLDGAIAIDAATHTVAASSSPAIAVAAATSPNLPGMVPAAQPRSLSLSLSASSSPIVSPVHSPRSIAGKERIIGGERNATAHAGALISPSSMQLADRTAASAAQHAGAAPSLIAATPHVRSPFLLGSTSFSAAAAPSLIASLSPRHGQLPLQHPQLVPTDRELSAAQRRQPHPLVLGTTAYREDEEALASSSSSSRALMTGSSMHPSAAVLDPFESLLHSETVLGSPRPLPSHLFAAPSAIVVAADSAAPSAFTVELAEANRKWTESAARVTVLEVQIASAREQLMEKEQQLVAETRAHNDARTQAQDHAFRDRALIDSLHAAVAAAESRSAELESSLASQLRAREATLVAHLDQVVHASLARDRERTECIAGLESKLQETRAAVAAMEKAAVLAAEEAAAAQADANTAVAESLARCDQLSQQLSASLSTAEEQSLAITALQSSLNASHDALVATQKDCDRTLAAQRGSHEADLAALASSHLETVHALKHDGSLAARRVASLELQLEQSASQLATVEASLRKLGTSSARAAEEMQARCHAAESELASVQRERDRAEFEAKAATQALMDARANLAQLTQQLQSNQQELQEERQSWASRVADLSARAHQLEEALEQATSARDAQWTQERTVMEASHATRVVSLEASLATLRETHTTALSEARDAAASHSLSLAQQQHEHAIALAEASRVSARQIDALKAQLAKLQTDMAAQLSASLSAAARDSQEQHESALRLAREQHAASLAAALKQAATDRAELSTRLATLQSQSDEQIAALNKELQARSNVLSATTLALHSAQLSAQRAEAELQRVLDASASSSSELEVSRAAWESLRARLLSEASAAAAQSAEEIRALKVELDASSRKHAARITELESLRLSSESRWQIEMAMAQRAQTEAEAQRSLMQRELQEAQSAITSVRETIAAGDAQRAKQHRTAIDALTQQLASAREELLSLRSTSESDRAAQQSSHSQVVAQLSQQLREAESHASELQDHADALDLMLSIQGAKLTEVEAAQQAAVESAVRSEHNEAQQALERSNQQHALALQALRDHLGADNVAALEAQSKSFSGRESEWSARLFSLEHDLAAAQMQLSAARSTLETQRRESSEREALLLALLPRDLGLLSTKELRQRKRMDVTTSPSQGKLATLHEEASVDSGADAVATLEENEAEGSPSLDPPLDLGEGSFTADAEAEAEGTVHEGSTLRQLAGSQGAEGLENSAPLRLTMLESIGPLGEQGARSDNPDTASLIAGYTAEIASLCASNAQLRDMHEHTLSILGIEEQKRREMQSQLDATRDHRTTLQQEERKLADLQMQLLAASTGSASSLADTSAVPSIPATASLSDFSPHSPPSLLYAALVSLHASAEEHDAVLTAHIREIAAQFEALKVSRDRCKTKLQASKEQAKRNKQQWTAAINAAQEELETLRRKSAADIAALQSRSSAALGESSARVTALESTLATLSAQHSAEISRLRSDLAAAHHAADLKHAAVMLRQRNMHDAVIAQMRRTHKEEIAKIGQSIPSSVAVQTSAAASPAPSPPARATANFVPLAASTPVPITCSPAPVMAAAVPALAAASTVSAPRSTVELAAVPSGLAGSAPTPAASATSPKSSAAPSTPPTLSPRTTVDLVSPADYAALSPAVSIIGHKEPQADIVPLSTEAVSSTAALFTNPPTPLPIPSLAAASPPIARNSILFALISASASAATSPRHARASSNAASGVSSLDEGLAATATAAPSMSAAEQAHVAVAPQMQMEPRIPSSPLVAAVIAPVPSLGDEPAPLTRRQLSARRLAEDEAATARLFDSGLQLPGITQQQLPLPLPPLPPTPRVEAPPLPSLPSTARQSPPLRTRFDHTEREMDPEDVLMQPFQ